MPNNTNNIPPEEEHKKVTEELYKRNLELVKLYKKVDSLNQELGTANTNLQNLITQRDSLIHLVTHKVKGAFTHSKYIFAGILDGSFGAITPELQKMAEKGFEADNTGIETVDLVLNADNLQKGVVKYDMQVIDIKPIILKVLEEKMGTAEAKGLKMEANIENDTYNILGDSFWIKEATNNLVGNAILYTKKGKITMELKRKAGKVILSIRDTGIGITEEDKKILFTEGGRGKNAVKENVNSTGYGLFSVKLIVEAHHGKVWAESDGEGKGSVFFVELSETKKPLD
jgi:signal transduction histidine kinase